MVIFFTRSPRCPSYQKQTLSNDKYYSSTGKETGTTDLGHRSVTDRKGLRKIFKKIQNKNLIFKRQASNIRHVMFAFDLITNLSH